MSLTAATTLPGDSLTDHARAPSPRRIGRAQLAFVLIVIAAAVLRLYRIDGQSLWMDELYSVQSSNGWSPSDLPANVVLDPAPDMMSLAGARPVSEISASLARGDNHPPLYFILLRLWRMALGEGPAVMRGMSVLASLIALALLTDTTRLLYGWTPALWAAAIMAVAGPQVQYAQEVRGYALLMAAGCGAMNAIVRIKLLGATAPRLAALALCLLAMVLTHFFAVGAAAGLTAYALIALRGDARRRTLAAMVVAALLFALLWGASTVRQFRNVEANNRYMIEGKDGAGARLLQRLATLPHRFFNEPMGSSAAIASLAGVTYLLPLLLLRRRPDLLLGTLYVAGGVGVIVAFDLFRTSGHLQFMRYTLVAAPGAYLLTVGLLADRRGWLRHVVPAVVVASCLLSLGRAYKYFIPVKVNWRAPIAAAAPLLGPRDALILTGQPNTTWYLAISYYHPAGPRRLLMLTAPLTADRAAEVMAGSERICVVGGRDPTDGIAAFVGDAPLASYPEPLVPPIVVFPHAAAPARTDVAP
ncbi:MAG: glycosyltransferase family 39 protein [Tepidisphaeraceae bacterium]